MAKRLAPQCRCRCQDVRIEDDVVRIESHSFGEEVVGPLTDRHFALGFRLSLLIKAMTTTPAP